MGRWRGLALLGLLPSTLLVSCGGDDAAEAPATSWWDTTPPATERPLGSFPVAQYWPTTVAPTIAAVTAASSGATSSMPADLEAALLDAVGETERAYDTALRDPDVPGALESISATTADGSPAEIEFTSSFRSHVAAGRVAVPNPDVAPSVTVEGTPIVTTEAGWGVGQVTVCHVDSDRLAMPDAEADGELRLLNDGYVARRIAETFNLVNGAWLLAERRLIAEFPGSTSCGAA